MKHPFLLPPLQDLRHRLPLVYHPPTLATHICPKYLRCRVCFVLDDVHVIDEDYVQQTFSRKSTSRPVEPTHTHVPSRSSNNPATLGIANPTLTKSEFMDIDPPTLDLRALSLNRVPGPNKVPSQLLFRQVTAPKTLPPPQPQPTSAVNLEDDEMEDLYGPPLGLPSPYALPPPPPRAPPRKRSPSLRYPTEPPVLPPLPVVDPPPPVRDLSRKPPPSAEPRVLPALAAEDPRLLGMLERHVQREAARPRQGMRKAMAVHRAGKRRGGLVLLPDRTEAETARVMQAGRGEPRGIFASYFVRFDS
jgi:hypothetical protein